MIRFFNYPYLLIIALFFNSVVSCAKSDWSPVCDKNEQLTSVLNRLDYQRWSSRVRMLSGVDSVVVGEVEAISSTRDTPALFSGAENAPAYRWLREQLLALYPESYIEDQEFRENYLCENNTCTGWRNLTLTVLGHDLSEEEILVTAHIDSISTNDAVSLAPGADDNASGAATLLELAALLPDLKLRRTVKLIWFTGEEQGLTGSSAWVGSHSLSHIRGVINIDSIARDNNSDFRMEIHAADDNSYVLAECVTSLISFYQPKLVPEVLIGKNAAGNSDHSEFWHRKVAAIMLSEDMCAPGSCDAKSDDANQLHHTDLDVWESLTPEYGFAIAGAAVATALSLAELQ